MVTLNSHIKCLPNFQEMFHICLLENEGVAVIGRNLVKTYHVLQYTVKWSVFFFLKIVFDFRSSGIRYNLFHNYGEDSISLGLPRYYSHYDFSKKFYSKEIIGIFISSLFYQGLFYK